jgi:hypothetical protein
LEDENETYTENSKTGIKFIITKHKTLDTLRHLAILIKDRARRHKKP